jgi:hypothetical protein
MLKSTCSLKNATRPAIFAHSAIGIAYDHAMFSPLTVSTLTLQ